MRDGEATQAQREAFGYALAVHVDNASDLARKVGVTSSAAALWLTAQREPSRRTVFDIEEALDLPPGSLSHLLGYLPVSAYPPGRTEEALEQDPDLSEEGRKTLLRVYRRDVAKKVRTR